jgi:hypothetical protein
MIKNETRGTATGYAGAPHWAFAKKAAEGIRTLDLLHGKQTL